MMTLYLCYQSLLDPLTRTQVVAYLEGLARAGYRPILVTFEPRRLSAREEDLWRRRLGDLGIHWRHLRYHKRPTVPATSLDIACGILLGLWLIVGYRVKLVHARSHVPAVMAAVLQFLTGVPFLFDIRGFIAEEYADAEVWAAEGRLYRATKRVERWLVGRAAGVVALTERAMALLLEWYPSQLAGKPLEVIPCCVDLRGGPTPNTIRDVELDRGRSASSLVYVGKLGGWYPTRAMVDFFAAARQIIPDLRWTVLTQGDDAELRSHAASLGLDSSITIGRADPGALIAELGRASAGLCLYRRERSAPGCSPTKIAEYLAAGLPVVASAGIGDVDRLLRNAETLEPSTTASRPIGVLVDGRNREDAARAVDELRRLLDDPDIRSRCRATAERCFDLDTIGWARYRRIYGRLIGQPCPDGSLPRSKRGSRDRSRETQPVPAADSSAPWGQR